MTETLRYYTQDSDQYVFYKNQHKHQTLEKVKELRKKYEKLDNAEFSMTRALRLMDDFVDPSDPDVDLPNSHHAYQTAERIRKTHPNNKALQVTGLIHDLGKVLFKFNEPNYYVVGDTYVLGCEFPKNIVFRETLNECQDNMDSSLNTKLGIYKKNCGLNNLFLAYGHDEYLYQVLKNNKSHSLPEKYWDIIRYHSFYPWHTGGEYKHFMNGDKDQTILINVNNFNQFDLYSKEDDDFRLSDEIIEYYDDLLVEFFPEDLKW